MPNAVDAKIDQITQAHVAECEKANVSRNVDETAKRVKDAIAEFSAVYVLASGYWGSLHDQSKVMAIRDAVLELATVIEAGLAAAKREPVGFRKALGEPIHSVSAAVEPEAPAPKKPRKAKAAA